MSNWTAENALQHHGILGQKWGVRRFQNKDGSWTAAGEQRYGEGGNDGQAAPKEKKKSKLRQKYETKYEEIYKKRNHMSDKEAKEAAEKRADYVKKIAIGAGAAVGVAATIAVARHVGRNYCDEVIKSGKMLQNLNADSDIVNRGKAFYVSFRKTDNIAYKAKWGRGLDMQTLTFKNKNVNKIMATKEMKIASSRNAKKIYNNLRKSDSEFGKAFADISYKTFNQRNLMDHSPTAEGFKEKYFNALQKAGYSGLHDLNDRAYSGFKTKATILFDKQAVRQVSSRQITNKEWAASLGATAIMDLGNKIVHPGTVAVGAAIIGSDKIAKFDKRLREETIERRKKANVNQNKEISKK